MTNVVEETTLQTEAVEAREQPVEVAPTEVVESGPVSEATAETPATDGTVEGEQALQEDFVLVEEASQQKPPEEAELAGIADSLLSAAEEPRESLREWLMGSDDLPRYEKVEFPGMPHPIWVERLDWEGFTRVGFLAATNKEGRVDFGRKGDLQRLGMAMFYVALHADEQGRINLFDNYLEALKVVVSTNLERVRLNILLFNEIMRINPSLMELHPGGGQG